jgi:hypothetical protein
MFLAGALPASLFNEVQMRVLIAAAVLSAMAFTHASAATLGCTSDNMAKSTAMMTTIPDSPGKRAADKELAMANTDMSTGKMKSACTHYAKAQLAVAAK